jgi:hypothetical protein
MKPCAHIDRSHEVRADLIRTAVDAASVMARGRLSVHTQIRNESVARQPHCRFGSLPVESAVRPRNGLIRSIGTGKMIVVVCEPPSSSSVCM